MLSKACLKRFGNLHSLTQVRNFSKVYPSALEATKDIKSGDKLCVGGFGICGIPVNLIEAVKEHGPTDLTCVSNNCGIDDRGLGVLLRNK